MLDSLILQVVLTALVIIAVVVAVVWFVWGFNKKSAVWIIALSVPIGIAVAAVFIVV